MDCVITESIKLPQTLPHVQELTFTWRISVSRFLCLGFGILLGSITWFLIRTILTDYWGSTYTHCQVLNVVPSVSAVARHNQLFWLVFTWESLVCRVIVAWLYARFYRHLLPRFLPRLGAIMLVLFMFDGLGTAILAQSTHISGDEILHKITVMSIWCSQVVYMTAFNFCYSIYPSYALEPHQQRSYRLKRKLVRLIFGCYVVMIIFYLLHNNYCLPLGEFEDWEFHEELYYFNFLLTAYSVFSLFEFILTYSTACYIWSSYLDFYLLYLCWNARDGLFLQNLTN